MPRLLVTGATGFVGSRLCERAAERGWAVRRASRHSAPGVIGVGEFGTGVDWSAALYEVDTVVHLAARVHVMKETEADPGAAFYRANVAATEALATQAAARGVRRLVFVSSIKVNGEFTSGDKAFSADDRPAPRDPYALSKWQAEEVLTRIGVATGMEIVVIRPPLVYGPGVKANFLRMMQWLHRGLPLPLGTIRNRRSLVALDNLVDLILTCVQRPAAANQTFLVSDGEDLSTEELLKRVAVALGKRARLIPVPCGLLRTAAALVGKGGAAQRLLGSLRVDIGKTRALLDWHPPVTVEEALHRTAEHFLGASSGRGVPMTHWNHGDKQRQ